jgi:hypothetical protein
MSVVLELPGLPVPLVKLALPEHPVRSERKGQVVPRALPERWVLPVLRVWMELLAVPALRERQVPRALPVLPVRPALRGLREPKVRQALRVPKTANTLAQRT